MSFVQPDVEECAAGRWSGQRERRRAEFVDAALAAIAEHGPQTSTEQIAVYVGVTRTKLYRHFTDASDLQRAVAQRAGEMLIGDLAPLWEPHGSMAQIIEAGVGAHARFLVEHRNLYRYLAHCSMAEDSNAPDAITDIKLSVGTHLGQVFAVYLGAFGIAVESDILAMGIVGMIETATSHWLDNPGGTSQERLIADQVRWIWLLLDDTLRAGGVYIAPDEPLPEPGEIARMADSYRDPHRVV
ncbi:TetR/AcrR family transcriptional regulator [Mycobacteroides saopaulense]|uniref:TetR/AcrR family transcriptional regulator n=1 Tax=Mycobacteroides saopaulense TaxID=1578165 RepID=UPI001F48734F|nr:TetR/AcrR family transcriptional regulator [Mycobacteroides saopaulense]